MGEEEKSIENNRLRRLASIASLLVASILIAMKGVAYWATDSIAVLSSLIDSSVDLLASLLTAFGIFWAMRPPDRDHRHGHGKAEALAALVQGLFIAGSGIFLIIEAIDRFLRPKALEATLAGFLVMGIAIVLTLLLVVFQSYVIRKTGSIAIGSDRMHYTGDLFVNGAVIVALGMQSYWDVSWVDPFFALLIAVMLLIGAYKIAAQAFRELMDAELPEEMRQRIIAIAQSVEGVRGVHDLRTRSGRGAPFISMHVEMAAQLPLIKAHAIVDVVEAKIKQAYPNADVLLHEDPAGILEERLDTLIERNDP